MNKLKRILSLVVIFSLFSFSAMSQTNENLDVLVTDTKNDLLVVVGGGLAGAILGLSTLSFVDEPKDHTKNIIVGASLGIIAGVGYVAFSQASKSREMFYEEGAGPDTVKKSIQKFDTYARNDWHVGNILNHANLIQSPYQLGVNLKF